MMGLGPSCRSIYKQRGNDALREEKRECPSELWSWSFIL